MYIMNKQQFQGATRWALSGPYEKNLKVLIIFKSDQMRAFTSHTWLSYSKSPLKWERLAWVPASHHAMTAPCHDCAWSYLAICHRESLHQGFVWSYLSILQYATASHHTKALHGQTCQPAKSPCHGTIGLQLIANWHKSSGQTDTQTLINVGRSPSGPFGPRLGQYCR